MTMTNEDKARENRVRRMAERQNLTLVKCRRRDPLALDYGRYWLHGANDIPVAVARGTYRSATLDEVEEWLRTPARERDGVMVSIA